MLAIQSVTGEHGFTLQYLDRTRAARTSWRCLPQLDRAVGRLRPGRRRLAGGLIAYFVQQPGTPATVRSAVTSFSAVAANFAGVPLAFAFVSTLGTLGLLTQALKGDRDSTSTGWGSACSR